MFELKGRFGIARQKVIKMIHGPEKASVSACSSGGTSTTPLQENTLPYVNHSLGLEIEKAQALIYYRRMLDTPR